MPGGHFMLTISGTVAFDSIRTPLGSHSKLLGGSGMFASVAASLFAQPYLVSIIGQDFNPDYLAFLTSRKIDLSGIKRSDGLTFHWSGFYEKDMGQAHTLATDLNVLLEFDPLVPTAAHNSRVVLMGNFDPALQKKAILQFKKPELVVVDTMNFWIENSIDDVRAMLALADVLILNDQELRLLTGVDNVIKALPEAIALGPKRIVVKKGEHGALMYNGSDYFMCPAVPITELVDPTGAGDTFAGAFSGYLSTVPVWDELAFRRAVIYGILVSSHTVQGFSVDGIKSLTLDKLEAAFETYKSRSMLPTSL
ncbi:MAG: sugar kinase [Candidatus Margulisbacteria bacterium]|nr:sugar kinase [Candidatus Margulisiibacteriota bacterium]